MRITRILRLVRDIRRAKMLPNATAIVGLTGRAQTAIASEGTVFVRGELWPARSRVNVSRGESVRVTGVSGLTLDIETEKDDQSTRDETESRARPSFRS